jgi:hypothetical protein
MNRVISVRRKERLKDTKPTVREQVSKGEKEEGKDGILCSDLQYCSAYSLLQTSAFAFAHTSFSLLDHVVCCFS